MEAQLQREFRIWFTVTHMKLFLVVLKTHWIFRESSVLGNLPLPLHVSLHTTKVFLSGNNILPSFPVLNLATNTTLWKLYCTSSFALTTSISSLPISMDTAPCLTHWPHYIGRRGRRIGILLALLILEPSQQHLLFWSLFTRHPC